LHWRHQRGILGRLRSCATVGALFLVAGHAAGLAHDLTAQHARCAEHGELLDIDETQAASGAPALLASRSEVAVASTPAPPSAAQHDHCAVAALRSAAWDESSSAESAPQPEFIAAVQLPSAPALGGSLALLRVAPKGSPPAI
jgi:hypothetical protein